MMYLGIFLAYVVKQASSSHFSEVFFFLSSLLAEPRLK